MVNKEGTSVAYITSKGSISIKDLEHNKTKQLIQTKENTRLIAWPDGPWIYYSTKSIRAFQKHTYFRIHAETGQNYRITKLKKHMFRSRSGYNELESPSRIVPNTIVSPDGSVTCTFRNDDFIIENGRTRAIMKYREITKQKNALNVHPTYMGWATNSNEWLLMHLVDTLKKECETNLYNWKTNEIVVVRQSDTLYFAGDIVSRNAVPGHHFVTFSTPRFSIPDTMTKYIVLPNTDISKIDRYKIQYVSRTKWANLELQASDSIVKLKVAIDKEKMREGNYTAKAIIRYNSFSWDTVTIQMTLSEPKHADIPSIGVVSVRSGNEIEVQFSKHIDQLNTMKHMRCMLSPLDTGIISHRIIDDQSVLFETVPLKEGVTYTLTISGIWLFGNRPDSTLSLSTDFVCVYEPDSSYKKPLLQYEFKLLKGKLIPEESSLDSSFDLLIENGAAISWPKGYLSVSTPAQITSRDYIQKIVDIVRKTNAFSIELWLKAGSLRSDSTGRILSMITGKNNDLFYIEQDDADYVIGLETSEGHSRLRLPGIVGEKVAFLAFTHDSSGNAIVYVNGTPALKREIPGDLSNWEFDTKLYIANTPDNHKPWIGNYFNLDFYALSLEAHTIYEHYKSMHPQDPIGEVSSVASLPRSSVQTEKEINLSVRYNAEGDLFVDVPMNETYTVELVSVDGRILQSHYGYGSEEFTFSRSNLASGIYMVRVRTNKKTVSRIVILP